MYTYNSLMHIMKTILLQSYMTLQLLETIIKLGIVYKTYHMRQFLLY